MTLRENDAPAGVAWGALDGSSGKARLPTVENRVIQVAVGVCRRQDGALLIARRRADATLPGLWEFPGGKLEAEESARQAVIRELREEVALEVTVLAALEPLRHRYADFEVVLHPFVCRVVRGNAKPLASQELRWAMPEEIERLPMPQANATLLPRVFAALRSLHFSD